MAGDLKAMAGNNLLVMLNKAPALALVPGGPSRRTEDGMGRWDQSSQAGAFDRHRPERTASNCSSLDRVLRPSSDLPVVPMCRRRLPCGVGQINSRSSPISRPIRGAFRDRHERWTRDAMDALATCDERG